MEDFILSTQILTEFEFVKHDDYKVRAIIFLVESKKVDKLFERDLAGNQMKNWVINAVNPIQSSCVLLCNKDDCFEKAKQNIGDEDFTICLFSDTPLVKNATIMEALDYAQTKDLDFCKLPRGFIVKSKNFVAGKISLSAEAAFVDKQEFTSVFDERTLCFAKDVLMQRILEKHLKNGVCIENLATTSIDCDVEIGRNVVIEQNNVIKGHTIINDNVVLKPFNYISSSIIRENSVLTSSCVINSIVKANSEIGPFEKLLNKKGK